MPRKGVVPPQLRPFLFRKKGGRKTSRKAAKKAPRRRRVLRSSSKGTTRRRSYGMRGLGLFKKLSTKRTLLVGGAGAVSNFVPPNLQAPAMMVEGAFVGSDALLDLGAYATGRQLAGYALGGTGLPMPGRGGDLV